MCYSIHAHVVKPQFSIIVTKENYDYYKLERRRKNNEWNKIGSMKDFLVPGLKKIKVDQAKKENQNFVILQQGSGRLQVFKNDPKNVYE